MIRIPFLILMVLTVFLAIPPQICAARTERIAVVVNEEAISISDVSDRMKLIVSSSNLPNSEEIRTKLTPQVIASLVDERIKMQEAGRLGITVDKIEIDQGFADLAGQNNLSAERFAGMLRGGGINILTIERQIESQIAWSKVIQQRLRPQVQVSDTDIDDVLERLRSSIGKAEYLLAEIYLPVEEPGRENDTKQLAERLVRQIKSGQAPFFKIAQQFSKAAGATQGGNLGWIQQGQLPEELDVTLPSMRKDEVSRVIRSLTGYHILYLRGKRTITEETIPTREQITNNLGVERLERLQRRHLLDLKAAAFIESRV